MIFNFKIKRKNSFKLSSESGAGFTLIELVIAIFILTVAIIGVYNAFAIIVISTTNSSARFTASYLAQDGMEMVRNIRDNNWITTQDWKAGLIGCTADTGGCEVDYRARELTAFVNGGKYLNINNDSGFYSYAEPEGEGYTTTKFKRKITITPDPLDPIDGVFLSVSVEVTWEEKGEEGCDDGNCIIVEEKLYNWY